MSKNKKPHPAGDAAEQGKGGKSGETISNINLNSGGAGCQGRIYSLLLPGEERALSSPELAKLAGYKNERSLRMAIDKERKDLLILASDKGYFRPQPGDKGLAEIHAFVRRMDLRMKSNRQTIRACKRVLKRAAKAPLDGQETIWGDDR